MRDYIPLLFAYGTLFVLIICVCLVLNARLLDKLKHLGSHNNTPNADWVRWAASPKPAVGGIGFFAAFLLSLLIYTILEKNVLGNQWLLPLPYRQGLSFVAACSVGFAIGLIDDAKQISPLAKFAGQLACALLFIAGGLCINLSDCYFINCLFTTLWVVGMMNSLNMLDNMDGITASVSVFVLLNVLLMAAMNGEIGSFYSLIAVGAMGSLLGFLWYNWHPSRMFMGDAGSQFLGALLSGLSIIYLWQFRDTVHGVSSLQQFLVPSLVFLLPLTDTCTVTIRRLARGQSPFVGGRDHTTHHLVYCGLTDKQVAWVFVALSLLGLGLVYYTRYYMLWHWTNWHTLGIICYDLLLFIIMQLLYNYGKNKKSMN